MGSKSVTKEQIEFAKNRLNEIKLKIIDGHGYEEKYVIRFLNYFNVSDGCWEWTKAKMKNYGLISANKRKLVRANRFSYHIFIGSFPDDLIVCHTCDNPSCVNPAHLFLGTNLTNAQDRVLKKRNGICDKSGERNGRSKLNWEAVKDIRSRSLNTKDLSIKYEVTRTCIYDILNRRTWNQKY